MTELKLPAKDFLDEVLRSPDTALYAPLSKLACCAQDGLHYVTAERISGAMTNLVFRCQLKLQSGSQRCVIVRLSASDNGVVDSKYEHCVSAHASACGVGPYLLAPIEHYGRVEQYLVDHSTGTAEAIRKPSVSVLVADALAHFHHSMAPLLSPAPPSGSPGEHSLHAGGVHALYARMEAWLLRIITCLEASSHTPPIRLPRPVVPTSHVPGLERDLQAMHVEEHAHDHLQQHQRQQEQENASTYHAISHAQHPSPMLHPWPPPPPQGVAPSETHQPAREGKLHVSPQDSPPLPPVSAPLSLGLIPYLQHLLMQVRTLQGTMELHFPSWTTLLHGDMQYGNVMLPRGHANPQQQQEQPQQQDPHIAHAATATGDGALALGQARPSSSAATASCLGGAHMDPGPPSASHDPLRGRVVLIDYDYCCTGPAAFDIANHFCEWAADYSSPTPHVMDWARFPSPPEQRAFVDRYLRTQLAMHGLDWAPPPPPPPPEPLNFVPHVPCTQVAWPADSVPPAQHSPAQHSPAQHSPAQHGAAQHSAAQHSPAQHSPAQHSAAQHSPAKHSAAASCGPRCPPLLGSMPQRPCHIYRGQVDMSVSQPVTQPVSFEPLARAPHAPATTLEDESAATLEAGSSAHVPGESACSPGQREGLPVGEPRERLQLPPPHTQEARPGPRAGLSSHDVPPAQLACPASSCSCVGSRGAVTALARSCGDHMQASPTHPMSHPTAAATQPGCSLACDDVQLPQQHRQACPGLGLPLPPQPRTEACKEPWAELSLVDGHLGQMPAEHKLQPGRVASPLQASVASVVAAGSSLLPGPPAPPSPASMARLRPITGALGHSFLDWLHSMVDWEGLGVGWLEARARPEGGAASQLAWFDGAVSALQRAALGYVALSHLHWGIWGLLQSLVSAIPDFDYAQYGRLRLHEFHQHLQVSLVL